MLDLTQTTSNLSVLDAPQRWRQDAVILSGLVAGTGAWVGFWNEPMAVLGAVVAMSMLSGAVMGGVIRSLLERLRGRMPLWGIGLIMPLVGALWAWQAVVAGVLVSGAEVPVVGVMFLAAFLVAPIGAVLVGLLWLPYAITAVMRLPRWPVAGAALALSAVFSWWWMGVIPNIIFD